MTFNKEFVIKNLRCVYSYEFRVNEKTNKIEYSIGNGSFTEVTNEMTRNIGIFISEIE
jgi:hypothetical protein